MATVVGNVIDEPGSAQSMSLTDGLGWSLSDFSMC
jgi:hypothetical protein